MAPWTIGKKITVTCDAGYVVSPPTPPEAAGFRAECVPGDPVWRYMAWLPEGFSPLGSKDYGSATLRCKI